MTEATVADLAGLASRSAKIFEPLKCHVEGGDRSKSAYANTLSRDTAKDALGFVNALEKLAAMIPLQDAAGVIVDARRTLNAIATAESFELDDDFKKVHEAAKELSREHSMMFRNLNVKAHPSHRLLVNTYIDDLSKTGLIDMTYKIGFALASAALDALEKARS
jgi:hypothetical protein